MTELTVEQAREILSEHHRRNGYVVIACQFSKNIGEVFQSDDVCTAGCLFRVTALATVSDLERQCGDYLNPDARLRPFLYRVEAMD